MLQQNKGMISHRFFFILFFVLYRIVYKRADLAQIGTMGF